MFLKLKRSITWNTHGVPSNSSISSSRSKLFSEFELFSFSKINICMEFIENTQAGTD